MGEVTPTYTLALKVWWALTWRYVPLIILAVVASSLALGLTFGIIGSIIGMDKEQVKELAGLAGAIMGLFLAICSNMWVIRRMMIKGFGPYRLTVMEKN